MNDDLRWLIAGLILVGFVAGWLGLRLRSRRRAERAEAARVEAEQRARLEAAERFAAEQEAEAQSLREAAERQRALERAQEEAQRQAALIAEAEARRLAEEARVRLEAARVAAEATARLAEERAARLNEERAARQAEERAARQAENERLERERIEQDRLQAERLEAERRAAIEAAEREQELLRAAQARAPLSPEETLVLVADDSKIVRVKTSRLLAQHGYRVALAVDGADAERQLREERPHVLITDVDMPELDGFELTRRLRAEAATARLPVIMITAADDKHREEADSAGVDVLLGKPYPEEALIEHIRRMTGHDVTV